MTIHHIGMATENIEDTITFLKKIGEVEVESLKVFDKKQNAYLQMVNVQGYHIELIEGEIVKNFLKKKNYLYHICYEVPEILEQAIASLEQEGAKLISLPKETVLFEGRRVCFLVTRIGIIELLEKGE